MKDPRELLALLTAKVQRFAVAPGGEPVYIPEDVAQALGLIKVPNAVKFARAKYCQDFSVIDDLAESMQVYILTKKQDSGWRIHRPNFILDMCYMALAESIDPHSCRWCHGRKEVVVETPHMTANRDFIKEGQKIVCDACNGSGIRPPRDADRAYMMGLNKGNWSDPWANRYKEDVQSMIDRWESLIPGSIRNRLGEPATA